MSDNHPLRRQLSRRKLLQGSAGLALMTALGGATSPARAAGGKVIIGAFADGGMTPFKEKIIPLAKSEGGFDVTFLEDEYGVTQIGRASCRERV
jgi:multiple sugar transport system substrate-binding protein